MTIDDARVIIKSTNKIFRLYYCDKTAWLDGEFTVKELEAIITVLKGERASKNDISLNKRTRG
jgi:hypothetical protein